MVMRRKESEILAEDKDHGDSFHHFFAALIQTYPARGHIHEPSFLVKICYGYPALDGIIRVHRAEKMNRHLVRDQKELRRFAAPPCLICSLDINWHSGVFQAGLGLKGPL
jgi:hypothetical protein